MQDNTIQNRTNPFFVPYNTPHDTVPFERIRLEDYEPAFMEGIRRDDEATDKIVNDPAEPTFENTIARVATPSMDIPRIYSIAGTLSFFILT